jgi:hypothetical protein
MTPEEEAALQDVRGLAGAGQVDFWDHAFDSMDDHGLSEEDLCNALMMAVSCEAQPPDRWKVEGPDLEGDPWTVVVEIEQDVVVVTVF